MPPYNLNDGYSPGQTTVVRVPGLDTPEALDATHPIRLNRLSRNELSRRREPVVVIDATTGERWPIWVELDSNAESPDDTALLIHPARNYEAGHRYIVAMRNLKSGPAGDYEGDLPAPEGFRYFRDRLPSKRAAIESQRRRFERVFRTLRSADVKRRDLYLAWDFTVASDENIAERLLHMRDDAFASLGDTTMADVEVQGDAPAFTVTSGRLHPGRGPGAGARGCRAPSRCPATSTRTAIRAGASSLSPMGSRAERDLHGELQLRHPARGDARRRAGRSSTATACSALARSRTSGDQQILGQTHNFVICATDVIGFSSEDVLNIATRILPDLGNFPELDGSRPAGAAQRALPGPADDPRGRVPQRRRVPRRPRRCRQPAGDRPTRLYYNGNSQGGILGGSLTAVAPDFTRATLGVPAMNYSVLLNRSIDFDTYKLFLDPAYPSAVRQQLALSLIQMIWDRSEANGYAHRMTDDPLPNTPAHEVLLNVAFGDHQVTHVAGGRGGPDDRRPGARAGGLRRALAAGGRAVGRPEDRELPVHGLGDRLLGQRAGARGPDEPRRGDRHQRAARREHPQPHRGGPARRPRVAPGGDADGLRLPAA